MERQTELAAVQPVEGDLRREELLGDVEPGAILKLVAAAVERPHLERETVVPRPGDQVLGEDPEARGAALEARHEDQDRVGRAAGAVERVARVRGLVQAERGAAELRQQLRVRHGDAGAARRVQRRGGARDRDGRLLDPRAGAVAATEPRASGIVGAVALVGPVGDAVPAGGQARVGGVAAARVDHEVGRGTEVLHRAGGRLASRCAAHCPGLLARRDHEPAAGMARLGGRVAAVGMLEQPAHRRATLGSEREQTEDRTPVARVLDQSRGAAEIARVALRRARAVECGARACGLDAAAERGDVVRIRRGRRAAEAGVGRPGRRGEGQRREDEERDGSHPGTQPHPRPRRQGKIATPHHHANPLDNALETSNRADACGPRHGG